MIDRNCDYMYRKVIISMDNNSNKVYIHNKRFRNIKDAIHYIDKRYIRIKRKLNRKKRNNAKMLLRKWKWEKLFESSGELDDK